MVPNYSGRLLDRLVLIVAKQTSLIRENPDEPGYAVSRGTIVEQVVWRIWEARNRLQVRRDPEFKP